MNESIKQHLTKKAAQLDLARGEVLQNIQRLLEVRYPGQTKAKSLHNGVLKLITPSSGVASELRLRQVELIKQFSQEVSHTHPIERLLIQIQTLT